MFTLRFAKNFSAPVGSVLGYVGMAKWRRCDPATGEVRVFTHSEANSYALDTGGMKGTTWKVTSIAKDPSSMYDEYLVTLDPS